MALTATATPIVQADIVKQLGLRTGARQLIHGFRRHNLALFEKLYPYRNDRAKVIDVVKKGRQQLESQMAQEREQNAERGRSSITKGWQD